MKQETAEKELMALAKQHNILRISAVNTAQRLALVKKYHKAVQAGAFPKEMYCFLK